MKIKNVDLKWYVVSHDFNNNKIIRYNVFFKGFNEMIAKDIKSRHIENREQFKEYLIRQFKYYYHAKTEAEIILQEITPELTAGGIFSGHGMKTNKKIIDIVNNGPYKTGEEQQEVINELYYTYLNNFEKIDIWYQLELNIDIITDYIIDKMQLFKK